MPLDTIPPHLPAQATEVSHGSRAHSCFCLGSALFGLVRHSARPQVQGDLTCATVPSKCTKLSPAPSLRFCLGWFKAHCSPQIACLCATDERRLPETDPPPRASKFPKLSLATNSSATQIGFRLSYPCCQARCGGILGSAILGKGGGPVDKSRCSRSVEYLLAGMQHSERDIDPSESCYTEELPKVVHRLGEK